MKKMTEKNLRDAFAGESQAHMKYLIFSEIADKKGLTNISKLFKAIAFAEFVHAKNHLKELGEAKDTINNLQAAIDGETYEVTEMYPAFNETAKFQEEKGAERSTFYALEAEKIHKYMYEKAKDIASAGKDIEQKDIYVCSVCGHTVEKNLPNKCPVCGTASKSYVKF
ncbi:MAG: rubrerythrin family protein [Acidobacteriota bacterium]